MQPISQENSWDKVSLMFSVELQQKIEAHIQYKDLYYVDYRDELATENLQKIIETWSIDDDNYIDFGYQQDSLNEIMKDIQKTFELDDDFIDEHDEEIRDIIYDKCSNDPLPDLIKNAWVQPIRLTAYSNYEGIRSDFDYSQWSWYEYSEGFKDIVDILQLDPQTLKKEMLSRGFKTQWAFPSKKSRLGKEYVSYKDFIDEINNSCSSCNLLTFVGLADVRDFLNHDRKKHPIITIPKGNSCWLFDNCQGSWSLIECTLLRDFTIDTATLHGEKSIYDSWNISIDSEGSGYSIDSVYGVTREFWGKEISVS